MGTNQSTATAPSQQELDQYNASMEAFYNAMSPITIEERKMQKRAVLQAMPNKYARFVLSKENLT